jgi:hypothetical protein
MVRPGPVVSRVVLLLLALVGTARGQADAERGGTPAPAAAIDRLPYKIAVDLAIAPEARIDTKGRQVVIDTWRSLLDRFVGAPWNLSIVDGESIFPGDDPETLEPTAFEEPSDGFDKSWVIRIGRLGSELTLSGREFDAETGRLGPTYRQSARVSADLPRALMDLALDLFRPSAALGEQSGGGVALTVRGASLKGASRIGPLVKQGDVFRPIRIVTLPDGDRRVLDIPFTYLRVESLDGALARCSIVSSLRDPLTRRIAQKSTLVALGSKPGQYPTRLRFLTQPDKAPAAGFLLTGRTLPDGLPRELGTTDREGRIVLDPTRSDGLLALRLMGGSVEPLVEFPLMPGESAQERAVPPFDPRSRTVALESQLDSLRDTVIDLVAVRARLEARLKARCDGEDWDGAEAVIKEFGRLPTRETFSAQLTKLREDAAHQQDKLRTAVLTKTAQAQIAELEGMIARYLDDDAVRAYSDAVSKARSDASSQAKAAGKAKGARKAP